MGRAPCCSKVGLHRGAWSAQEDALLTNYIQAYGEGKWKSLPQNAGLLRCGKSCRLRWMNYLRPGVKRGNITAEEEDLIIQLHSLVGNSWSLIAGRLPGRTDNEIKNHWNTHILKRLKKEAGLYIIEPSKKTSHKKRMYHSRRSKKQPQNVNNYDDDQMYAAEKPIKGFTAPINICAPVESLVLISGSGSGTSTTTSTSHSNYNINKREVSEISWPSFDHLHDQQSLYELGSIFDHCDQHKLVCNNKDPVLIPFNDDCDLSIQGAGEVLLLNDNLLEQFYHEYVQLL